MALFGPRPNKEQAILSAAVAAAAAWPLLVLGIAFPRLATFVLAFVPLSKKVPSGILRATWAFLALAVPIGLGLLLSRRGARRSSPGLVRQVAEGFPATFGVACAFLVVAVAAPIRKLVSFARRRVSEHVPVVADVDAYEDLADGVEHALERSGERMTRGRASLPAEAPIRLLRSVGGPLFRRQLPRRLVAFRGRGLVILLSPNGLVLTGPEGPVMRLRALLSEALTFSAALQTLDPEAQKIEKRLKALADAAGSSGGPRRATDSLERVVEGLLHADVPGDDWQVLHRELLQAACAMNGKEPLLASIAGGPARRRPAEGGGTRAAPPRRT